MKRKKGISLIILAVTVIVMIIISSAVILTITGTDIIDESENTVKDHNLAEIQSAATMARSAYVIKTEKEGEDSLVGSQKYITDKLLEKGLLTQETLPDYYISKYGEVEKVDRTAFILECEPHKNTKRVQITLNLNGQIDWGDGTVETYAHKANTAVSHTYSSLGRYDIKITGNLKKIVKQNVITTGLITKIKSFGEVNVGEIIIIKQPIDCLPVPSEKSFENLTSFSLRYSDIENIPDNFFANAPLLTGLPAGFIGAKNLKTIPENCFSIDIALTNISQAFEGCMNLRGNAPELWNSSKYPNVNIISNSNGSFYGCQKLNNYEEIPDEWKADPRDVTSGSEEL